MSVKIEVKNLYKIFGDAPDQAFTLLDEGKNKDEIFEQTGHTVGVNNVSLEINRGEIFVIMGLSGSGKSTLVRLLNRLITPTRGQVIVDGVDIAAIPEEELRQIRLRQISMVFQSFALMPHMNVSENAALGLELAGVPVRERQAAARNALAQVGLEAHESSYPDELSGGMQQRVGLARALAIDPEILLMDEAFSALDPLIRSEMQDELVQLQSQSNRTVVFISHDLDEAMRIGDRIAIMEGGLVVQVGTPQEILDNPANDYVRSFFRGVDNSQVFTAGHLVTREDVMTVQAKADTSPEDVRLALVDQGMAYAYVTDEASRYQGVIALRQLKATSSKGRLNDYFLSDLEAVRSNQRISEIIAGMSKAPCAMPVVDADGRFEGVVTQSDLLAMLDRTEKTDAA